MFSVRVKDRFSSAHRLVGIGGKCESLHGHNYLVEVEVEGESLDEQGVLLDFRELKDSLRAIISNLDHKFLNEIDFFKEHSSSSEHIAYYIFKELKQAVNKKGLKLKEVSVWESDDSCAKFREGS